ncbi:MAG: hypothetical protein COB78_03790 [Hyphomicrobiales bacterium]|nr:MAG: hypothetical protein COB78_03790 [Hyphomicrobiales bacterium]
MLFLLQDHLVSTGFMMKLRLPRFCKVHRAMGNLSIQSHYGGVATFSAGYAPLIGSNSQLVKKSGIAVPSVSLFGSPYSMVPGAIDNILDLVASLEKTNARETENSAKSHSRFNSDKVNKLTHAVDMANWTKDDVVDFLIDVFSPDGVYGANARNEKLIDALKDGSANVVDTEELGYHTDATYDLRYNYKGEITFEYVNYTRSGKDVSGFEEEFMIRHPDGSATDRATGLNATRVKVGAIEIYITYP